MLVFFFCWKDETENDTKFNNFMPNINGLNELTQILQTWKENNWIKDFCFLETKPIIIWMKYTSSVFGFIFSFIKTVPYTQNSYMGQNEIIINTFY